MADLTHTALGAWSGGRFLHFGEPIDEERLIRAAAARRGNRHRHHRRRLRRGRRRRDRRPRAVGPAARDYRLVGAIGHDIYDGERQGAKGYPRFTDPALRGPDQYGDYVRRATERSLERCGVDRFDLLLLHNPDRTGFTSEAVWDAMRAVRDAGLTDTIGVAPGPRTASRST